MDDPIGLDGTLIRVDPDTGEGLPDNPLADSTDPDARRYGFRNPFRFAIRPGTSEPWVGDVGGGAWEEINRIPDPTGPVKNHGWPCFEGNERQSGFDAADLNLCEKLYAATTAKFPLYTYRHFSKVYPEETCPTGSSSISGLEFSSTTSTLPKEFRGALFFADYSRGCIWVMERDGSTLAQPDADQGVQDGGVGTDGSPVRPRQRPVLHGLQRGHDQADPLQPRQTRRRGRRYGPTPRAAVHRFTWTSTPPARTTPTRGTRSRMPGT